MIYLLVVGLAVWVLGCGYTGYHQRFRLFLVILAIGMGLNTLWMVLGLQARPFSPPAMTAHAAALLYAVCALGIGWIIGRTARRFRDSKVEKL